MFGDGPLTFQEFASREPLPLARVHDAVLEFLRGRDDAVLCGAQAVNAYVDVSRMTQDVDIISPRAAELAKEMCSFLRGALRIRVRLRERNEGAEYRIEQVRKAKPRHLVDVRAVSTLPPTRRVKKVLVLIPEELIANKVVSMVGRRHHSRKMLDRADLCRLLLALPKLKTEQGPVLERLRANGATKEVIAAWNELVSEEILPEDEDDNF
jgi:hypothetical protein